jgi:hypothetical protein
MGTFAGAKLRDVTFEACRLEEAVFTTISARALTAAR